MVYVYVKLNRYNLKSFTVSVFRNHGRFKAIAIMRPHGAPPFGKRLSLFQSFCDNILYVNSHMVNIKLISDMFVVSLGQRICRRPKFSY